MAISSKESQTLMAVLTWLKKHFEAATHLPSFPTYLSGDHNASVEVRVNGNTIKVEIGSHDTEIEITELRNYSAYAKVNGSSNRLQIKGTSGTYVVVDYNDQGTEHRVSISENRVTIGNNSYHLR